MSADHAPHQAFVAKVIESPFVTIPLSGGVDQREIARLVLRRSRLTSLCEIERFYCQGDLFGEANADKAACCNRVPISYELGCVLCGDDLSAIDCFDWR